MCIHFFTKLQNATEVDASYSSLPDPPVNANWVMPSIINHKNVTTDYIKAHYKTRDDI